MQDLKEALLKSPALCPIDYLSGAPVILSADTSYIAIGHILSQCNSNKPRIQYFAKWESRFSQSKLELYGLYRALRSLKLYLIGLRNLIVEVDAKYIKGMLANPDIVPSASINRWILGILMFQFTLVHIPGSHHGPDGLSRRRPQPGDTDEPEDDFEDWIDRVNSFVTTSTNSGFTAVTGASQYLIMPKHMSKELAEPMNINWKVSSIHRFENR